MLQLTPTGRWLRVVALGAGQIVAWGATYYSLSVLLPEAGRSFGWSGAASAALFSVTLGCAAASSIPMGRWMARRGVRPALSLGAVAAAATLAFGAYVGGKASLVAFCAALGLIQPSLLYEPAFAAVASWFDEGRGRALTVVTLFGALSSPVFVPLTAHFVAKLGWRGAFLALAGMMLLLGLVHLVIVPSGPRERESSPAAPTPPGRLRGLWPAALAAPFVAAALTAHWFPAMSELGVAATTATAGIAVLGAAQLPGRLLLLVVERRLPALHVLALALAVHALGVVGLLAAGATLAAAALTGMAAGAVLLARAAALVAATGPSGYARAAGTLTLGSNLTRALGPWAAAVLHAVTGRYVYVLGTLGVVLVCSAALTVSHTRAGPRL